MLVTKQQVIAALQKEPLKRGQFIHDYRDDARIDGKCYVCAVGALLRGVGVPDNQVENEAATCTLSGPISTAASVSSELGAGKYMNALSCFFEGQGEPHLVTTPDERNELIQFVEDNFPDAIEVRTNVDYLQPEQP